MAKCRARVLAMLFTLAAVLTTAAGIVSLWFVVGFGDYSAIGCGVLDVTPVPPDMGDFGIWPVNPLTPWRVWLRTALSLPIVELRAGRLYFIGVPLWLPGLLFGALAVWLWHRSRLPQPGRCRGCGYDLRGNVSGRCPECRRAVAAD